jgi:predicted membrane protein
MVKSLTIKQLAAGYLSIGFAISIYQNLFGELTAFAWAGSVQGNLLLLFWWLILPASIWPWDLFWGLLHWIFKT